MGQLDELVDSHPVPTGRKYAWGVMVLLGVVVIWTYFTQLDEYASAEGEVIPQSQVRDIQSFERGIVEAIYVQDGDIVEEGAQLIALDLASGGNLDQVQAELDALLIRRERLEAEAESREPVFPKGPAERLPNMAKAESLQLQDRRDELRAGLDKLQSEVRQKRQEIKEFQATLKAAEKNLALAEKKVKMGEELIEEALISKVQFVEWQQEVENLNGQVDANKESIPKAKAALAQVQKEIESFRIKFRREARTELGRTELEIAGKEQILKQAKEKESRTVITSPINGVVKGLAFNSIGNVVRDSDVMMQIVPIHENLIVEAKLNPIDRGYVREGQPAVIKVSSYDFVRYGGLDGEVSHVAADSSLDDDGTPFFRVLVTTEKAYLGNQEGDLPITSGMQATVDIQTGSKSVMEYLVRPVLKIRYEAFHER